MPKTALANTESKPRTVHLRHPICVPFTGNRLPYPIAGTLPHVTCASLTRFTDKEHTLRSLQADWVSCVLFGNEDNWRHLSAITVP